MKQGPRNTAFAPWTDQTYLIASETERNCKSLKVTRRSVLRKAV